MVTLYTVKEYVRHMIKRIAGHQKCHGATAVNLLFSIGRILGNGTFPNFCPPIFFVLSPRTFPTPPHSCAILPTHRSARAV